MKKYLLILLVLLCFGVNTKAEQYSAYEGTRFLVSFMQNENYIAVNPGLLLQLYITAREETIVKVRQPYHTEEQYVLKKDSILIVNIDVDLEMYRSEVALDNAIEVLSDLPITVTAFNSQPQTTDSYAAIPVNRWGKRYVVLSQANDQYHTYPLMSPIDSARALKPRSSEFLMIADEDGTVINFRPRAITAGRKQLYRNYSVTLNKGECYLVKSAAKPKGEGDLTGTVVTGNKPFGFLSGHVRAAVPQFLAPNWDSKNHLVEMLHPVKSWGRKYATIKLLPNSFYTHGDMMRVSCFYPNTRVNIKTETGYISLFLRDSGDFKSLKSFASPAYWVADKPIQIGQYLMRHGEDQDRTDYDPALLTVPSIEQFVQSVIFMSLGNPPQNPGQFKKHFVSLIATKRSLNTLIFDNRLLTDFTTIAKDTISGTSLHYARFAISKGKHSIKCQHGGFSAVLSGVGHADAYAHTIGSSINNPYLKDTIPPIIELSYDCGKVNGFAFEEFLKPWIDTINTGLDYAQVIEDSTYNFTWNITPITDTTTFIKINAEIIDARLDGAFVIDIRDRNGNGRRFRFRYNKLRVRIPAEFDYGNVEVRDSVCRRFIIINDGSDTLLIKGAYLAKNDTRVLFSLNKKLPYYLPPGDTIKGIMCFKPNGDTTTVSNQLVLVYDCDLLSRIPVKARVLKFNLITANHNFGIIRVGDTTCSKIYIVNGGNADIVINSLVFNSLHKKFSVDTVGVFPKTLKPGDTLFIRVCFLPDSVGTFTNDIYWKNSKNIDVHSTVTGTGGAPNFESIIIDWGDRRVGTKNDTVIVIKNTGNWLGRIKYKATIADCNDFDRVDLFAVNYAIKPNESVEINSSFIPSAASDFDLKVEYSCDWDKHKPIVYELKGRGTIPAVKTYDIDFGIVNYYSSNDSLAIIIESSGNEQLLIYSAFVKSSGIDDFTIDLTKLKNLKLPVAGKYSAQINFNPKTLGYHQAEIGVVTDAAPNYGRDTVYFKLFGTAIMMDTIRAVEKIVGRDEVLACHDYIYTYSIHNTGNIDFDITSLELSDENLTAEWQKKPVIPSTLAVDSTFSLDVNVDASEAGTGTIRVKSVINDTIFSTTEKQISIVQNKIILGNIPGFKTSPGDSLHWEMNGTFPNSANRPVIMQIKLKMNKQNYMITKDTVELVLTGKKFAKTIKCKVLQTIDKVFLTPLEEIILSEDEIKWKIILPFYVFLYEDKKPNIEINISTDRCFDENGKNVITEIENVCVFNIRAVILDNSRFNVQIHPNPASDKLNCEFNVYEDIAVNMAVFDINGKKSFFSRKIFLKKGNNSRIFEISSLTNGVYVLKITAHAFTKNIIFIIIK